MSKTTTTPPDSVFGYDIGDYVADDSNGHVGTGSTAEKANEALQRAQENDFASSYYTDLLGWVDTPKD